MFVWTFLTSSAGITLFIALGGASWQFWQARSPRRVLENIELCAETIHALNGQAGDESAVRTRLDLELQALTRSNERLSRPRFASLRTAARAALIFLVVLVLGLVVLIVLVGVIGPVPNPIPSFIGLVTGAIGGIGALVEVAFGDRAGRSARKELDGLDQMDLVHDFEQAAGKDEGRRDQSEGRD